MDTKVAPQLIPLPFALALEESPRPEDLRYIEAGLSAYNRQYAPEDGHRTLNIFLRAADQTLAGGLLGDTYWGWLYVRVLWLDERVRRQGLGEQLLQAAEQEALRRGCRHAHLDTMSFQALPFYEKQGYTVFGVLEDLPAGHSRIFLQKKLAPLPG
jgi:GNAT superfamily N-acetyltransferase